MHMCVHCRLGKAYEEELVGSFLSNLGHFTSNHTFQVHSLSHRLSWFHSCHRWIRFHLCVSLICWQTGSIFSISWKSSNKHGCGNTSMEGIEFLDYMPRKGMGVYGSLYLSVSMSLSLSSFFSFLLSVLIFRNKVSYSPACPRACYIARQSCPRT